MAIDRDKVARNALRFIQRGQYQKAIDEYRKVLSADPRDIRTRLKLIDLYRRAGRTKETIEECHQVAEAYADQGFYLKAIAVYKQALRSDPENPILLRETGEMYVKQGLIGDALGAFKRGVDVLRRQNKKAEAEQLLVRMEEMAPENAAIKVHLSELYLEEGKLKEFEDELSKLILQLRGEGRSRMLLQALDSLYDKSGHHAAVLKRYAEVCVDLGEEERAVEVIREGLAHAPGDRDLRLLALRAHLVLGQLREARRMALALYEEDPGDLFILEQLAAIAQARGDDSELVQAHKLMAVAYGKKGLAEQEERCYRKVLELAPDDAEARLAVGDVMASEVRPADTAPEREPDSIWDTAPEETPSPAGDDPIHDGIMEAELYLKYGIEEKADAKLRELLELAPGDLEIRQKLRDLCQRRGDRQGWVQQQLQIADLLLHQKRESESLRAYQSILEIEPGNVEAEKAIQYLRPDAVTARPKGGTPVDVDGATIEFVTVGDEEQVLHRAPAEGSETGTEAEREALREGLGEADFYEAQELPEEAKRVLLRLRERFPDSPHVNNRLERLGWTAAAAPASAGAPGEDYVDLQSEVLDASDLSFAAGFEGFEDFEVSELDDIVREFKSGIADKLDDADAETHYNLGLAYREMGLMEEAVEEFQKAARAPEKAREAYTSIALAYHGAGRPEDAMGAYRLALAVPTNSPEDRAAILYEMAVLSEQGGDWDSALRSFDKVSELVPNYRDVRRKLQAVKARLES